MKAQDARQIVYDKIKINDIFTRIRESAENFGLNCFVSFNDKGHCDLICALLSKLGYELKVESATGENNTLLYIVNIQWA